MIRPQTSINLGLGSAAASIGRMVPTVAAIAWWTGTPLELGVSSGGTVLLALARAAVTLQTAKLFFLALFNVACLAALLWAIGRSIRRLTAHQ